MILKPMFRYMRDMESEYLCSLHQVLVANEIASSIHREPTKTIGLGIQVFGLYTRHSLEKVVLFGAPLAGSWLIRHSQAPGLC